MGNLSDKTFRGSIEQFLQVLRNFNTRREHEFSDPFYWRLDSEVSPFKDSKGMILLWDRVHNHKTLSFIHLQVLPGNRCLLTIHLADSDQPSASKWWNVLDDYLARLGFFSPDPELTASSQDTSNEEEAIQIPSDNEEVKSGNSVEDHEKKPYYFPKRDSTVQEYKTIYAIITKLRKIYKNKYKEERDYIRTDNPEPSIEDFQEAVTDKLGRRPGKSKLYNIISLGDEGLLK